MKYKLTEIISKHMPESESAKAFDLIIRELANLKHGDKLITPFGTFTCKEEGIESPSKICGVCDGGINRVKLHFSQSKKLKRFRNLRKVQYE